MARNNKRRTGKEANALGKMWIPVIDRELMRDEGLGLLNYWLDCWQTDPFGNRWTLMAYGEEAINELKSTTKAKYRKRLTQLGLFIFKEDKEGRQRSLYVLNLHGSRAISPETLLDASEKKLDHIEKSLDENEKLLDAIEQKSRETLSYSAFENSSISDQYLFSNLSTCNKIENPGISSSDDSLRSTQVGGCEEEKSSVPMKDLEVLQHPLSNEENLGSHSKTNSSSAKTTTSTEPSCSSSQKKRLVSTSDDGSVESIRFRSAHGKTPQSDVRSHDDAPQAASASVNAQSHRNLAQSPLKAQLGGSQLEAAIEELEESLQAVADDLEMTVEGGIDELCRRFAGLATETEVELLPVPREYPYYDRMNEWVLYENNNIICFLRRGPETRRLTIGCFR